MKTKKTSNWSLITLAIVFIAFAEMYSTINVMGYILVPMNRSSPAILSTVITTAMVFLALITVRNRRRSREENKRRGAERSVGVEVKKQALLAILLPLFAILFVISKAIGYDTDGIELHLLPVYAIIALICSMVVFFAFVKKRPLYIGLGIVYSIFMIPMFIWLLLWDFGQQPVVLSEMSPDGTHLAEVANVDRGVFGKNTFVYVTPQDQDIDLPIGVLKKTPQQIYKGAYFAAESMTLRWEADDVLLINGNRYTID